MFLPFLMRQAFLNGRKVHAPKWGIESELFCFLWRRRCKTLQTKKTQELKAASLSACLALARFYYHLWRILENGCGPVHIDAQLAQWKQGGSSCQKFNNCKFNRCLTWFQVSGPTRSTALQKYITNTNQCDIKFVRLSIQRLLSVIERTNSDPNYNRALLKFFMSHTSQASRLEIKFWALHVTKLSHAGVLCHILLTQFCTPPTLYTTYVCPVVWGGIKSCNLKQQQVPNQFFQHRQREHCGIHHMRLSMPPPSSDWDFRRWNTSQHNAPLLPMSSTSPAKMLQQ